MLCDSIFLGFRSRSCLRLYSVTVMDLKHLKEKEEK